MQLVQGGQTTIFITSTQSNIITPRAHAQQGVTYLCFFDLEKAFDSVEYSTLLTNIFNLGINGKCFRLIKDWYTDTRSIVRVNNQCSQSFPIHRGVKQGSVLSPSLFIVVIDSLLSYLASSGLGLKVSGLNVGFSAHADDVRAASNSIIDTQTQGKLIASFCSANNLKLNANKTELVQFTSGRVTASTHNIAGQTIHTQPEAKCLGVWWRYNLPRQDPWRNALIRPDGPFSHSAQSEHSTESSTPLPVAVCSKHS